MFRKLNTYTEGDLEFFNAAQRKLFPKCNFFRKNPQKIIKDKHFFTKNSEICIFCAIECDRDGLTS